MTLVEISEQEVLTAAKALFVECLEVPRHFSDREVDLLNATSLLIARESAEQALNTGTVPHPEKPPVIVSDPATFESLAPKKLIELPPMVEGQCHWEVVGEIVTFTPDCQHVVDSSIINEEDESGNASGSATCIHGAAAGVTCPSCKSLGGRAVDCPVKCPYCQGACKRGFEGHEKHRCATNSSHAWGAEPITRRPKKLSRKAQEIEARRRADVSGQAAGRDDIDYGSDELPSAR